MQGPEVGVGLQLKRAREARGLTVADLAAATCLSARSIEAIERDRFDQLPNGIYRRSYIRAYAEVVGLDSGALVQAYRDRFEAIATDGDDQPPDWPRSSPVAIAIATILAAILVIAVAFA